MSYINDYQASRERGSRRQNVKVDIEKLHQEWYPVFIRFNPDKNGEIKLKEMRHLLAVLGEMHKIMTEDAIDEILALADKDSNGRLSYTEFIDLIIGYDLDRRHRPIVRKAFRAAALTVVPKNERTYVQEHTCSPPPLFMLAISIVEIAIFVYHTVHYVQKGQSVGFNSRQVPSDSVLIYNPFRRYEAWRFATYMFVHSGFMHIIFNVFIQLIIGIPLEMVHRWWRVMLVYFAGVIAGSVWTSITDPKVFLCGASGGVYALMFAHLASIILNWSEMEFAWLRLLFFSILTVTDVGVAIYDRYFQDSSSSNKIGYVAHLAGAIAGLLVGINVLRNLRKQKWEQVVWWVSLVVYVILMGVAIAWNIWNPDNHFPPSQ